MSDPIPSATVVLLRDTPSGMKVLLLKRNSKIAYGGSWVFPGGRIDQTELDAAPDDLLTAAKAAAVRETSEEAGVSLKSEELLYFAHWTTPNVRPKRFSTWFFLASVSEKAVQIDGGEIHEYEWHTPNSALAAQLHGQIELPAPTFVTMTQLVPFTTVTTALDYFVKLPPIQIQPRMVKTETGIVYLYNSDAGFEQQDPHIAGLRHRLVQPYEGAWEYINDNIQPA